MYRSMGNKKKPTAWILFGLWLAWTLVGQPLWNLNVERVAEGNQLDRTLARFAPMRWFADFGRWLSEIASYLPSSFATGFVIGALIFAYWDTMIPAFKRLSGRLDNTAEMRAWVGVIAPNIDRDKRIFRLWFSVISVGLTPVRPVAVEGSASLTLRSRGEKYVYDLTDPKFEREIGEAFAARGHPMQFSVEMSLPAPAWHALPAALETKPFPSVGLANLKIHLESEAGTRKELRLWESLRLSSGDGEIASTETMKIFDDAELERLQSALGAVVKRFGAKL